MGLGRQFWTLRARLLGAERVVTKTQVNAIGESSTLGVRGRARLQALLLRELVLGPASRARVRVGDALLEIGGDGNFAIDWKAFVEVLGEQPYQGAYEDAAVLDVGAHKGYFAAYALAQGARSVVSYEPALRNFGMLERAALPLGDRWRVRPAALGATAGTGVLFLDETSWAHSLVEVERPAGEQRVTIVTLEQALAELPGDASSTIVKIDAEGAECDILADPGPLARVDVLMVEVHPAVAPCSEDDLVARVSSSGLRLVGREGGALRFAR